jgi:hypothetical protein
VFLVQDAVDGRWSVLFHEPKKLLLAEKHHVPVGGWSVWSLSWYISIVVELPFLISFSFFFRAKARSFLQDLSEETSISQQKRGSL